MPAWECYACTWLNDECNVDCLMCQTKRDRNLSPNAGKNEESSVCREADSVSNNVMLEEKPLRQHNYKHDDNSRQEPAVEVKQHNVSQHPISMQHAASSKRTEKIKLENNESNSKWDAFASLENNYESSDSDEDESDSDDDDNGSEHYDGDDKEYNQQYDDGKVSAEQQSQWNAFESLEANLGDDSSTSGSSSGEESDCILIDDQDEEKKMAPAATSTKSNLKTDTTECVDLVDTDDEEDVRQGKNSKPKRIKSRKRKRVSNNPSAITLLDGDSDSSYLSEVESSKRPFQTSSATRQGIRSLPPWQRAARSKSKSPSILENDSVMPRESFSLLSNRNDVNGSGLNETRTSAPPAARQPKQRKSSTKSSTSKKTGSRRRKRSNSDGAAPAKTKRRTRKYRRSSKRGGRGGRGRAAAASSSNRNNNPWGARERGIRQPIRDNNGSGSYMNITKQEPMLRNVGGASMQF